MRNWQHSHNLRQTSRDRLNGIIEEFKAERANFRPEGAEAHPLSAEERLELERIDRALPLLEEAHNSLAD